MKQFTTTLKEIRAIRNSYGYMLCDSWAHRIQRWREPGQKYVVINRDTIRRLSMDEQVDVAVYILHYIIPNKNLNITKLSSDKRASHLSKILKQGIAKWRKSQGVTV